jgi:putative spermidine/putrescine transport system permease protein
MVKGVPGSARVIAWSIVLFALCYMLAPLLVVAGSSLTQSQFLTFPPRGVTLHWYFEVFRSEKYLMATWTSLKLATLVSLLSVTVGTMAAIAFGRFRFKGIDLLSGLFLSPLVLPAIIFGIGLLMVLSIIGTGPTFWGLVLGHLVITLPYVIRTVSAVMARSDLALEEAARTLGANWFQRYWYVVLPQCRQGIIAGAFFAFNVSFDDTVIALFVRSPGVETLPIRIYSELEFSTNPSIAAVSTVMILITVALIFLIERFLGLRRVV